MLGVIRGIPRQGGAITRGAARTSWPRRSQPTRWPRQQPRSMRLHGAERCRARGRLGSSGGPYRTRAISPTTATAIGLSTMRICLAPRWYTSLRPRSPGGRRRARSHRTDARCTTARWHLALRGGFWLSSGQTAFTRGMSWTRCAGWKGWIHGSPSALERGAAVYLSDFFDTDGRPRLWRGKRYPEDSHCAGTGLTVLTRLVARDSVSPEAVRRLAQYTLKRLIHRDGHAVFRRYRWGTTHVRYLRWCDGPVALGLASATALFTGNRKHS